MVIIKKTGEGYYLASLETDSNELSRTDCYLIKKELTPIVRPHRNITFDIKGVKSISGGGYKILQELMNMAVTRRCKIRFINIESSVSSQISNLMAKAKMIENEIEFK